MAITWRTEVRAVKSLKDYAKNPRKFTEKGMRDLKASLKRLGYIDPISINTDGTIIGGHARKKTLIELGITSIDVRVPSRKLTDKQMKEALIRLNRNTAGEWDFKILEESFEQADLVDWGFEASEFNSFAAKGNTDPDEAPELEKVAISKPGQIWTLGGHRIACGSATDAEAVTALLAGEKPMLMVTDPPYGVEYDAAWRNDALAGKPRADGKIGGGGRAIGKVENDDTADWTEAWKLFPGDVAYVWHAGKMAAEVKQSLSDCDFVMRSQIIWAKSQFAISRGDYHWQHEPCWYAVRGGAKANWQGSRKQTTLWEIDKPQKSETGHSTQKPVECMQRPMENNSKAGDYIYEPFSGSGTTIIAAEITGRRCLAMELNPLYVDMAIKRWQEFTGKAAINYVTGEKFNFLEAGTPQTAKQSKFKKKPIQPEVGDATTNG